MEFFIWASIFVFFPLRFCFIFLVTCHRIDQLTLELCHTCNGYFHACFAMFYFFFFGFSISTGIYAFPLSFLSSASDALNGGKEHLFVVRHFSMHLSYFVPHSLYRRCIDVPSMARYLLVEFQCDDNFGHACGIPMAHCLCLFFLSTIPPMDVNENIEL